MHEVNLRSAITVISTEASVVDAGCWLFQYMHYTAPLKLLWVVVAAAATAVVVLTTNIPFTLVIVVYNT